MEKAGDLLRNLGFREDASDELKKAFVRNLMRAAFPNAPLPPVSATAGQTKPGTHEPEQLAFSFDPAVTERRSG